MRPFNVAIVSARSVFDTAATSLKSALPSFSSSFNNACALLPHACWPMLCEARMRH